ncbi:unnamed protein product [Parnassius apollo]|uniref:(apollo) hypothetical protein n=1 Tax=Parnassius apollo TaxID=110799 RepID=A0A8S3VYL5_PARAO|nr:unnamed protein product [Parnassius apollo]
MEYARPPAELSLKGGPAVRAEAWRQWRRLFEVFLKVSGVSKKPKEIQASLLVNLIGSATVTRFKFFSRNQENGENIDQYVTALRVLSRKCDFGDLHESLLRDKIVCGIVNNTVRDRLLRTDDLRLSKAIQICQAAEISKEEILCIDGNEAESR